MSFKLIFLNKKSEWTQVVESLPADQRDLHFLPEYGEIYAKVYGYIPFLAVLDAGEQGLIAQPFVQRPLRGLPFLSAAYAREKSLPEFFDIANPYGYGGPAIRTSGDASALIQNFESEFLERATALGWASEFTSVHPLLGNSVLLHSAKVPNLKKQKNVVYLDLSQDREAIWRGFDKGHKSSVKKAQRLGVEVEKVATDQNHLAIFQNLYLLTMKRRQAASRWHFPESFFIETANLLGPNGASLFFARHEGVVIACYFLIHGFSTAYLHFAAADENWLHLCPNNLLMFETAMWAKAHGYRSYHLGGGVSDLDTDPLFSFKAGFSKAQAELTTYFRILNSANYELLCDLKRAYERESTGQESNSDFFPLYRR